jgi:hypothetical protein
MFEAILIWFFLASALLGEAFYEGWREEPKNYKNVMWGAASGAYNKVSRAPQTPAQQCGGTQ